MKQRKNILLEDKEGKNLAKARHYLVSKGYNSNDAQQLLNNIRTDIPNTYVRAFAAVPNNTFECHTTNKTIIITEEQKKKLTESILSDTPSDDQRRSH